MTNDLLQPTASLGQVSRHGGELQAGVGNTLPRPTKTVLLAEDNEDDIFLMKMACERTGIAHLLQIVTDGEMAMDYLCGNGHYADRSVYPMPSLVFLDINLPKQNGFEVLKLIRAKPGLKKLPVIMLSNSTTLVDVDRAYQLGVTSYVKKISNQAEFGQAIWVVLNYWLQMRAPAS